MMSYAAAGLLLVATLINAVLWRSSRSHYAFFVSLFAFISLSGKVPQIYDLVNNWTNRTHGLELIIDLSFVACVWALDASIGVSTTGRHEASPIVRATCIIAGVVMLVSFIFLAPPRSAEGSFNEVYSDEPLFLVYRVALAVVTTIGCAHAATVVARNYPSALLRLMYRFGAGVLAVGLGLGVIVGIGSGLLGAGEHMGVPALEAIGRVLNEPLRPIAAALVALGLVLPPIARWSTNRRTLPHALRLLQTLRPVHEQCEQRTLPGVNPYGQLQVMLIDIERELQRRGRMPADLFGSVPVSTLGEADKVLRRHL